MATRSAVVVAGPGVVPGGVGAVRVFAAATGVGVLNTYGAKGLFRWDDPAHLGTIGLQARDVELAGVLDAEVVLAVGLDPRELGVEQLGPRAVVVGPDELAGWSDRVRAMAPGRLYGELRAALLRLYDSDQVPLTPAAAAADLGACLPPGGLVCAVPGTVGLWIARALPTTELGSVLVPPDPDPAVAAGVAARAAAGGRTVVLASPSPVPGPVIEALDAARAGGLPLVVELWSGVAPAPAPGPGAPPASREGRRAELTSALAAGGPHLVETPVDLGLTSVLEAVAGPVSAW
jgi:hypothetical protein